MKKSSENSKSDLLRLSVTLFTISCVMAMLVSLVSNVTKEKIEKINSQKVSDALSAVMTEADSFFEYPWNGDKLTSSDGKEVNVDGVWKAMYKGEIIGVCVKVSPKGYGGAIETIVGVGLDGKIVSAQIVSMSETSGIGTKISDNGFLSQFIGKQDATNDGVTLISGATKSSKAYLRGINAALTVAHNCLEVIEGE